MLIKFNYFSIITIRSLCCLCAFLLAVLCNSFVFSNTLTVDQNRVFRVLFINSYSPGYSWSDDIENGLREHLQSSAVIIELSVEYLDSKRFVSQDLLDQQADVLFSKYSKYKQDLIVVSDNAAFDFAVKNRSRLFPEVPIVFCGYNALRPATLNGLKNITGVNEEIDIDSLISAALHIQQEVHNLVFVISTDNSSSRPMAEKVETEIAPKYRDKFNVIILKDASLAHIKKTLAGIASESALFMIGRTSEKGKGRALTPAENSKLVVSVSPIPVYTFWSFHLNTGVIGGRILSGYDQGKTAGEMALLILNGKSADRIPVLMKSPTRSTYDYNVLKRFNVTSSALPENSTVINKPKPSFEMNLKKVLETFNN